MTEQSGQDSGDFLLSLEWIKGLEKQKKLFGYQSWLYGLFLGFGLGLDDFSFDSTCIGTVSVNHYLTCMHQYSSVQLKANWWLRLSFCCLRVLYESWLEKRYLWQNPLEMLFHFEDYLGIRAQSIRSLYLVPLIFCASFIYMTYADETSFSSEYCNNPSGYFLDLHAFLMF